MLIDLHIIFILILFIILFIIGVTISYIVWEKIHEQNKEIKIYKNNKTYNILSFICLIIAILSYVCNIGLIRAILLAAGFPIGLLFIHYIIFFIINNDYGYFSKYSKKLDCVNKFNYITYILFWILLPDGGDDGFPYTVLFRIVKFHNDIVFNTTFIISVLLLLTNIVLLIIQYNGTAKIKKQIKLEQNTEQI